MKDILSSFTIESRRKMATGTTVVLALLSLEGCGIIDRNTDPNEVLDRVEHNHQVADITPDDCYDFTLTSGGVHENLIRAIKVNPDVKSINDLAGGVKDTASDINAALVAIHEITEDDDKKTAQVGDQAEYCIDKDKVVVPGDPLNFYTTP